MSLVGEVGHTIRTGNALGYVVPALDYQEEGNTNSFGQNKERWAIVVGSLVIMADTEVDKKYIPFK